MLHKMWAQVFFRYVIMHAFDKRTDERTERSLKYRALHYMQLHRKNRSYLYSVWLTFW